MASEAPFPVTHGAELEAVYANAPVGLCVLDRELRFVRINDRLAEINGPSVAEHLGRTIHEVIPDLAGVAEPALRRVLETGEPALDIEVRGITPALPGVERYWQESWIPLRDADGTIVGINIVARETTAERATERRLRESERQFRALVEQSPLATIVFDREGRIALANQACETLWGTRIDALPPDLRIANDPQLSRLGVHIAIARAFAGERVTLPSVRFDPTESDIPGLARTVSVHLFPILDERQHVMRIVAVMEDVSTRAEEERDQWFLYQLGSELQALTSSDAICEVVTRSLGEHLSASRCAWVSVDADSDTMSVRREWRRSGAPFGGTHVLQRWSAHVAMAEGPAIPEVTVFEDTRRDPRSAARHDELFEPLGVRAFVRVPLVAHGRWLGSLALAHHESRQWSQREIDVVRRVAERAFPAFEAALQGERAEAERTRLVRLQHVTAHLAAAATQLDVCDIVAGEGSAAVGATAGVVVLVTADGEFVEFVGWHGYPKAARAEWQRLALAAPTPITAAIRTGEAIWIDSVRELSHRFPDFAVVSQVIPTGSWGVVPFRVAPPGGSDGGAIMGAIGLSFEREHSVEEGDRRMAETIAALGASALERVRLYEAERSARVRTERLQRVTVALTRTMTASEVAAVMMTEGMSILGADGAVLALRSEDGGSVEIRGARGVNDEIIATWQRVPIDAPLPLAEAVRTAEVIEISSREAFGARYPALASLLQVREIEGSIVLPLMSAGHVIGACSFDFRVWRPIASEERDLLRSLASQCAQALDRARLFEREHDARRAAELANQAKSTFLAAMSHELRTPLNAIQGHVQLIELEVHGAINDAQRAALERVQRNQRHLLTLVNDLLNLSRIESGRVEYHLAAFELAELVGEVSGMIAPQLEAKSISYDWLVDSSLLVWGDREKVAQILINLLDNAVKFTPEGGRVSVSSHVRTESPEYAFVRVSDTGRGIRDDKLKRIFEPFVQIDKVSAGKNEGVGLGLAISRELARGMRGDLRARSHVGRGSTFTLSLRRDDGRSDMPSALVEEQQ